MLIILGIVIIFIFIIYSYFIKNDDTKVIIKSIGKNVYTAEHINKGLITNMQILNGETIKDLISKGILHKEIESKELISQREIINVNSHPLIKPNETQKKFFNKYNQEQNKIMKADTEFQEKFMEDYRKMKNKELTIHDMVEKYKVDDSTIYRRGKRWSK